jgi:penicillin-binding protein 1A
VVGAFALFGYSYARVAEQVPELDRYAATELAQTSVVYDAEGNVVDELYGVQNRYVVDSKDIDPTLREAIIAIEDHRFYEHRGLDFEAIGRAARENLETLSIREGGSTITQQLVKNTYIAEEQRAIPSFQRKFTEASLAWQYEKRHSKQEILEQYLNTVYFGANAYGAEAASRTYFNKPASELDLPESALLAGIVNLPGTYDPFNDPETAKKRRDVVLGRMLEYGQINEKEHREAVVTEIKLSRGRVEYENDSEYFLDAVRKEIAREYGDDTLYGGGLKIYTTLDPRLQEQAASAVDDVVDPGAGDPSASLVSVEPSTGAVKALVGGSDFEQLKYNLATEAKRQPGSTFKAFVLAEAVRQGIAPETRYVSKKLRIKNPPGDPEPYFTPGNYGGAERGPITLETATEQSDNTAFIQLAQDVGMENVADLANRLGIESEVDTGLAAAIGGLEVCCSPKEMASAYSTFANGGEHMEPFLVEKVTREENGEEVVVEEHQAEAEPVLSRDEAAVVTQTLRGVVEEGTASYFHDLDAEIGRPSAGKTGTTNEFKDAWFVGYVPQLATSVWVGYPEPRPMVNINGLEEINGENYPLDIWSRYMQGAVSGLPVEEFDEPSEDLDLEVKRTGRAYANPTKTRRSAPDGETTTSDSSSGETATERYYEDLLERLQRQEQEQRETVPEKQPETTPDDESSREEQQYEQPQPQYEQPQQQYEVPQQQANEPVVSEQPPVVYGEEPVVTGQPAASEQPLGVVSGQPSTGLSRQPADEVEPETQPSDPTDLGNFDPDAFVEDALN